EHVTTLAVVQDLRILVEVPPDAVTTILAHDAQVLTFDECLDRSADVADMCARADFANADPHRFLRDVDQPLGRRGDLADREHTARVSVPAVLDDGHVDAHDVALFEPLLVARNAVADYRVHRRANRLRESAI